MSLEWYEANGIDIDDSIGIDEVGRGPLAGPVISAAVWICQDLAAHIEGIGMRVRDSKKMTHNQRALLVKWINAQSIDSIRYSIGFASVQEIDGMNILNAAMLSMKRAHESLGLQKGIVLVDGNTAPNIGGKSAACQAKNPEHDKNIDQKITVKTIVRGDEKVLSISIASIIAKEYRDSLMRKLSEEFPNYNWDKNAGYGTKAHLQAIHEFGITDHHRKSFAPISKMSKFFSAL
jgi:ribonuclease HII